MPDILSYKQEIYRKIIHIFSSSIALLLWYFGKDTIMPWIFLIAFIFPIFDYLKNNINLLNNIYNYFFNTVTRESERSTLSGASWIFIGSALTIYLFDKQTAIVSLLVMSLSDSAAAIIGIKYGTTKLINKSLEGTFSFIITAFIIIYITMPYLNIFFIIIISIITSLAELLSIYKINDNILVPITLGLMLSFVLII